MRPSLRTGLPEMAYAHGWVLSDREHARFAPEAAAAWLWLRDGFGPEGQAEGAGCWTLVSGALETALYCDDPGVALAFAGRWLGEGGRPGALWRQARADDLPAIDAVGDACHPGLPEAPEVMAEKLALCPEGCIVLAGADGAVAGYGICHPWTHGRVPPLDAPLGTLPESPDCLFLHDCAILEGHRGGGGIGEFVAHAADLARAAGITTLAGVSVYGTWRMLDRYGFALDPGVDPGLLASYGETAKAVVARLKKL